MYYSDSVGVRSVILCDTANQQFQMKRSNKEDVYSLTIFLYLHIALLVRITGRNASCSFTHFYFKLHMSQQLPHHPRDHSYAAPC